MLRIQIPACLHPDLQHTPLASTFRELLARVAEVDNYRDFLVAISEQLDPRSYHYHAQRYYGHISIFYARLNLVPGIAELRDCWLAIGEPADISRSALVKLLDRLCPGDPFDDTVISLAIPEVVRRLREAPRSARKDAASKPRRSAGRPRTAVPPAERRIVDAWKAQTYSTKKELAYALNMPVRDVSRIIDRNRKRERAAREVGSE